MTNPVSITPNDDLAKTLADLLGKILDAIENATVESEDEELVYEADDLVREAKDTMPSFTQSGAVRQFLHLLSDIEKGDDQRLHLAMIVAMGEVLLGRKADASNFSWNSTFRPSALRLSALLVQNVDAPLTPLAFPTLSNVAVVTDAAYAWLLELS